jgi:hypothetical protein
MLRITAFDRTLAVVGTVIVALPLLAPVVFTLIRLAQAGDFRFDFLMPAELYPLYLVGVMLLLIAAVRTRLLWFPIGASVAGSFALLALSQWLAVLTGLASGDTPAEGWPFVLVLSLLAGSIAAMVGTVVLGVRLAVLLRQLN